MLAPHQVQLVAVVFSLPLNVHFDISKDWPLIIADFLEDPDSGWIENLPPSLLNFCKKEATWFCFRGPTFCRVMPDQSTMVNYSRQLNRIPSIKHYHESLGHLKTDSIFEIIARRWWWPNMKQDIKSYIRSCPECQLNASSSAVVECC